MKSRLRLYCFNWPSHVGGADTKFVHLLRLLHREYEITVVPNTRAQLAQRDWVRWLRGLGVRAALLEDLPQKLSGWALSLCNGRFWGEGLGVEARRRGLRIAWSSEMMWHHAGELAAARLGLMDKVLYVSETQRAALEPGYVGDSRPAEGVPCAADFQSAVSRISNPQPRDLPERCRLEVGDTAGWKPAVHGVPPSGVGAGRYPGGLRWQITGNYIDPAAFPFRDRTRGRRRFAEFVVGRLSRPDPAKFPPDFPESYLRLKLRDPRFRVMAWSEEMSREMRIADCGVRIAEPELRIAERGGDFVPQSAFRNPQSSMGRFRGRWDLLPAGAEAAVRFLHALDLFVYDLRKDFTESWGRAVVEAMLTGAVPLVTGAARHHLRNLVPHGEGGYLCGAKAEWRAHAQRLQGDVALRRRMARAARDHAERELCDAARHRAAWREVFED